MFTIGGKNVIVSYIKYSLLVLCTLYLIFFASSLFKIDQIISKEAQGKEYCLIASNSLIAPNTEYAPVTSKRQLFSRSLATDKTGYKMNSNWYMPLVFVVKDGEIERKFRWSHSEHDFFPIGDQYFFLDDAFSYCGVNKNNYYHLPLW